MAVPLVVDRRSRVPLNRQIYDQWRDGILAGRFRRGARVPSTRELAEAYALSRTTVTAAYEQLIAEGYFETAHGSGTFVSRDLPEERLRPAGLHSTDDGPASRDDRPHARLSAYGRRLPPAPSRPAVSRGTIDLSRYGVDFEAFPLRIWRRLILRHVTAAVLDDFGQADGNDALRREIASYLARSRAVRCTAGQVVIVNGSQQALDLCARVLVDTGHLVAVEHPGYQGARVLFAAHGARVTPVAVDEHGLVVKRLARDTRLVHVTPSHQFPTGVSMSLARRLELLEWARQRGVVIVEDDYDSEYRYSGAPLPAMQGLSDAVSVVYVGTFSNVMFPGLRIGYAVLPPDLVEPFRRAKWQADRHTPLLEQAALADFLREGHLERHVRRMRRIYARRREVLVQALHQHLGDAVTIAGDAAGTHLLVRFASNTIPTRAKARGVMMASTERFYEGEGPAHEYILRISAIGERAIREAVRRLAS